MDRNLRLRILSALLLIPLALVFLVMGGWAFLAFLYVLLFMALREWLNLTLPDGGVGSTPQARMVLFSAGTGLLLTLLCAHIFGTRYGLLILLLFSLLLINRTRQVNPEGGLWMAAGLPYLAACGLGADYLRQVQPDGLGLCFFVLYIVWGTDTASYFIGRHFGGALMAPGISPKKTWSGFWGGLAGGMAAGTVSALLFLGKEILPAVLLAAMVSLFSQGGDLLESWLKRRAGVKDSGGMIPGHGGILDRIDGLVLAIVFFAAVDFWVGWQWIW